MLFLWVFIGQLNVFNVVNSEKRPCLKTEKHGKKVRLDSPARVPFQPLDDVLGWRKEGLRCMLQLTVAGLEAATLDHRVGQVQSRALHSFQQSK